MAAHGVSECSAPVQVFITVQGVRTFVVGLYQHHWVRYRNLLAHLHHWWQWPLLAFCWPRNVDEYTGPRFPFNIDHFRVSIRKNRKLFYFVTSWEFDELGKTRMHSSRMRTGRSLTICWRLLPGGSGPRGGAWSRGVCFGGCLLQGGAWSRGGVCSRWGWYPGMHWGRTLPPLWTDTRL